MNKKILISVCLLIALLLITYFSIRNPVSNSLNQKGLDNYNNSEYQSAEKYFKKSLIWKSNSSVTVINLIKSQLAQDKLEKALISLNKLSELSPDHPELFALEGQLLAMEDDFEEAIVILDIAIEKDSLLSYAYYYRGIAKANINDLDGAAADYLKARELDKENIDILKEGAIILSKLEDFDAAIENYDKLLELDPSNTQAFLSRATFKMKILDFNGAIVDFSSAIALDDQLAEAYFGRGKSYANNEDYEKAITDFDKSIQLNYKTASANYNSGLACLKLNQPQKAKKYLNNCIKTDTESEHTASAYHLLGIMELMQNNNKEAINHFNSSLKIDPDNTDTYFNRGIAYGMIKKPQEALNDLNKCIQLGMKTSDVYFAMGVQKIGMNNYADGCRNLKTASEMGNQQAVDMLKLYCKE